MNPKKVLEFTSNTHENRQHSSPDIPCEDGRDSKQITFADIQGHFELLNFPAGHCYCWMPPSINVIVIADWE